MTEWQTMVEDFHRKFGVPVGDTPHIDPRRVGLREGLIYEEAVKELWPAMRKGDLAATADAIVDAIYVLIGTAVEFGIDLEPLMDEVHAANMRKEGGGMRSDGKILKPKDWQPPRIAQLLLAQVARTENARR